MTNAVKRELDEKVAQTYSPQLNDLVYYFFQGHEEYLCQYSCHFYSGEHERFRKSVHMPWLKDKSLKKKDLVLCRVTDIKTIFPTYKSIDLMDLYGSNSTDCVQKPQVI